MGLTILTQGSFTSTGAGVKIPVPQSADYFECTNLTQMATTQGTGRVVRGEWYGNGLSAANDGVRWKKTNSTSAINMDLFSTSTSSNGFTYVKSFSPPEAAITGTAITAASPAVVTMTNTYSEGDRVILYGSTGMLQISGMNFTISSVSGSGFTLLGLDSSAFAAPATAVVARRIPSLYPVEPEFLYVTKISQATQAVITVSTAHQYVAGMLISFTVPDSFGMSEISGLTGKIVSVGTYTITVDIDSTGFSAFSFPTSASSPTSTLFATVAPAGQRAQVNQLTGVQTGYNFSYAPFHSGQFFPFMYLAGGAQSPAGSNGDVIVWKAYKMEATSYS